MNEYFFDVMMSWFPYVRAIVAIIVVSTAFLVIMKMLVARKVIETSWFVTNSTTFSKLVMYGSAVLLVASLIISSILTANTPKNQPFDNTAAIQQMKSIRDSRQPSGEIIDKTAPKTSAEERKQHFDNLVNYK